MLKRVIVCVLLYTVAVLPGIAICQDRPFGKWWQDPRMCDQLNLTDEEKNKLDEYYTDSRRRLIDLKSRLEKERFELDTLLESEEVDNDAVRHQFEKLEQARSKLSEERFNFLMKSRTILGNKRFQEVKRMYKKERRNRHTNKRQLD